MPVLKKTKKNQKRKEVLDKGEANRMRYISMKMKNKTIRPVRIFRKQRPFAIIFFVAVLLLSLTVPSLTYSAQKKPQAPPKPKAAPVQKEILVNDANLLIHQKRVEDLVEKGDFESAVKTMLKMNDYAKEVLSVAKVIKVQYETVGNNPEVPQNDKEDLFIKLRELNQLISKYTNYYEASTFNLGYMYAKLGETEKGRKYLVEFLQMTPYSGGRDSQWIKAKTLLLELYSLEGEF
jgi:tetratricopeptide (TPR) repeat protein